MYHIIIAASLLLFSSYYTIAQKKVTEVSETKLLSLPLPPGSKQDHRLISTASAGMLLEMVSQKAGVGMKNTEVYYLPASATALTKERLVEILRQKGYELTAVPEEDKSIWAFRGNECYLIYLTIENQETNLYIGECTAPPSLASIPPLLKPNAAHQPEDRVEINTAINAEESTTSNPASHTGWQFNTTNFSDGWSATQEKDWVKGIKGSVTVLLHYGLNFDDAMRMDALEECWKRMAAGRYHVVEKNIFRPGTFDDRFYYMEVEAVENKTGNRCFIGFSVVPVSGIAYCIEAVAPRKELYKNEFPNREKLESMLNSNRFAVHLDDLVGTWKSFSSSAVSLYNVYTGGFAGMNMAAVSDEFSFEKNGTYSSRHAGASNLYSNAQFFDNKYKGQVIVNNWEISLSDRQNGRTDVFHAHFEAVRGGRILYLQNKQYSGIVYKLVRVE